MAKKKKKKQQAGQQYLSPKEYMKQRARSLEIGECYVSDKMTECGEGVVVVTRRHTGGRISLAMYLLDIFCLGVKDTHYRLRLEEYEVDELLGRDPYLRECSYEEAHNWVYGAISWAEEAGIEPHKSFAITKYMLEEDTEDIPLIEYEFGHNGKHLLMANSNLEASRYIPLLKKNLGEGNFDFTIPMKKQKGLDRDDLDEEIEGSETDDEGTLFLQDGPATEYTYHHPKYPTELQLESPEWFYRELNDKGNLLNMPEELITRILSLPHDMLRRDLERIVMYHVGLTCDDIPEDYYPDGYPGILPNSILLLGEVGNSDSSLDVVLEVLRQSFDFSDYHFYDSCIYVFAPTLYLLGRNRLDKLMNFMKEEGLDSYNKSIVFFAVNNVFFIEPERREEVIAWYREMIQFITKMLPKTQCVDCKLTARMIYALLALQAKELLPELREMFATVLVDLNARGDFAALTEMMDYPRLIVPSHGNDTSPGFDTNIYHRFADVKRYFEENTEEDTEEDFEEDFEEDLPPNSPYDS